MEKGTIIVSAKQALANIAARGWSLVPRKKGRGPKVLCPVEVQDKPWLAADATPSLGHNGRFRNHTG